MKEIIYTIIGSAAFGITFAELSGIPNAVKTWLMKAGIWYRLESATRVGVYPPQQVKSRFPRRIKPFDCGMCLSFWTCMALTYFHLHLQPIDCILTSCVCCLFSTWAMKQIKP